VLLFVAAFVDASSRFAVRFAAGFFVVPFLAAGMQRGYPTDETRNSSSAFCA